VNDNAKPTVVRWLQRWDIIVVVLVLLLFAAIRWRLRDMPLERDEGEYAYAGQLILQGIPPYQIAYNMKLPGTYAAYAVIMGIFGQTAAGIRIGLLLANTLTILLVFSLGKRLLGTLAGVVAGASYALLSIGPWVNGFAGHATHFVVLAAMAGLWLLLKGIEEQRDWEILCAGLLLGFGFLMKQPGAAYAGFGGLYLLKTGGKSREQMRGRARCLAWFSAGVVLPFTITCLVLWRAGVFAKFWFWTFAYAYQYGTNLRLAQGWGFLTANLPLIILPTMGLWIFAGLGLSAFFWSRKARANADFLLGLLLFSSMGLSAGLYFRRHYFLLMLPVVSLLAGLAVSSSTRLLDQGAPGKWMRCIPAGIFAGAFALSLFQQAYFFFQADPVSATRFVYWPEPFPELRELGNYIREHSSPSAQIAVLGSEPEVFFYARRRSATGYLYTYSLTEEQKYAATMQREAIVEIETAQPEFVVFVRDWVVLPGSDRTIFDWSEKYIADHYELVGIMRVGDGFQLRKENEIANQPGNLIGASFVFRRRAP
jgi:4-amino-4-deoxy-L-arabinose transferase-like glycosyltransferase